MNMRSFIGFVFVASTFVLNAQNEAKRVFRGAVQAGFTSAQVHGDGFAGFDKAGAMAGFVLQLPFKQKSSVQVELNYVMKGSFDPPNYNIGKNYFSKIRLDYVEMPIQYNYKPHKWIFSIGASAGFLTKNTQESYLFTEDLIKDVKPIEIATVFGVGYQASPRWNIVWRNSLSLLPISGQAVAIVPFWGIFGGAYNQYMGFQIIYFLHD